MKAHLKHLKLLTYLVLIFSFISASAQEFTAGINTETPNPNAVLHLVSPNGNQGLLVPSLTTAQRNAMTLTNADNGLMVFDTGDNGFYFWVNPVWVQMSNTDQQDLANVLGQSNDAGGNQIKNVADPTDIQDVATKNYVDTRPSQNPVSGDAGNILVSGGDGGAFLNVVDFANVSNLPANLDLDNTDDIALTTNPAAGDISGDYSNGFQIEPGVVSSLEITNGTITDADISDVAAGKVTGLGTAATLNVGVADGDVVQVQTGGQLPALDGSLLTGVTASVAAGSITTTEILDGTIADADISDVTAGKVTGLGTAATLNVGVADGDVVQVQTGGQLPALDGSLLTGVTSSVAAGSITTTEILDGTIADADISDVTAGKVTGLGTAATLNVGVADGDVVQVQTGGQLPALDGSLLTGVTSSVAAGSITTTEILDGTIADADISDVAAGKVTGLGTAATQNVGTAIGDVLQFGTANTLPALDGSNLTNLPAPGLANGNIFVGDVGNNASPVTMSGDVTIDNAGVTTLGTGVVTTTEILDGTIADADISDVAAGKVTGLGTAATLNVGVADGDVVQVQTGGQLPALDGSLLTGVTAAETDPVWVADRTTLGTAGTINTPANLVDWTQLKSVPADCCRRS